MERLLKKLARLAEKGIFFFNDQVNIETLRDRLLEINNTCMDLINKAEGEERELTDEELESIEDLRGEYKRVEKRVQAMESIFTQTEKLAQSLGRKTDPEDPEEAMKNQANVRRPAGNIIVEPHATRGNHGFRNVGEFALAVHAAKNKMDPRLIKNAPTTYGTEGVAADGGFAVPPDFRDAIWEKVNAEDSLLARTDQMPITSNTLTIPKDETTDWDSSGGIQAYWEGEASALTESKPLLESMTLRTNKVTALIPISEELLEDAPSLDSYLRRKTASKLDYKITNAIVNGSGVGQPLGILGSGCLTSVAKESGQAADTVVSMNIAKMWSRLYAPCRQNAVWLINQDVEPQLDQMSIEGSSGGVFPVYLPPGGYSNSPYGTLKGRPVIPIQACQTVGDKGDILLVDLTKYLTVIKGSMKSDVSMHLYFNYDMLAFRFIIRITGQPWWRTYITPDNGTNYLSCFVSLDERT